jgi:transcriptional regulator with XRE-family HTH domain
VEKKAKKTYYKDEEALKRIGGNVREIRILRKMSQEDLANEIEVDYSQINRMELGKVNFSISHLYRVARALKINPKDLLE